MLLIEALESRIAKSELGQEWIDNSLLDKDVWSLEELGYSKDELNMRGAKNLHFEDFSLSWLKLLTKLAILSTIRKKHSLTTVSTVLTYDSIWRWLEKFSQKANLTDKQGRRFKLTSHKFRHTKASIMLIGIANTEENIIALTASKRILRVNLLGHSGVKVVFANLDWDVTYAKNLSP